MPQSSRLKSAKPHLPSFSTPLAVGHGGKDSLALTDSKHHFNHSEVSHHRQNLALHLTYRHAPKPTALDLSYLTYTVKVHYTS